MTLASIQCIKRTPWPSALSSRGEKWMNDKAIKYQFNVPGKFACRTIWHEWVQWIHCIQNKSQTYCAVYRNRDFYQGYYCLFPAFRPQLHKFLRVPWQIKNSEILWKTLLTAVCTLLLQSDRRSHFIMKWLPRKWKIAHELESGQRGERWHLLKCRLVFL